MPSDIYICACLGACWYAWLLAPLLACVHTCLCFCLLGCLLVACMLACMLVRDPIRAKKIKYKNISFLFPKQLSWFHEETRNTIFVNSTIASNYFYFMVVFLETRSNDINGHHVLWLVTMSSDWSPCPPIVIMSIMLIMILSILVIMPTSRLCGQGA